jgi:hypothetical protein
MKPEQVACFVKHYKSCGEVEKQDINTGDHNMDIINPAVRVVVDSGDFGSFPARTAYSIVQQATILDSPPNIEYWVVHVRIYAGLRCLNRSWKQLVDGCITPMHEATANLFRLR